MSWRDGEAVRSTFCRPHPRENMSAVMTILDDIVARTRARLASEPPPDRPAAERAARNRPPFALTAALRRDGINVIAEIKSASPSAGSIVDDPDVESIAG